MLPSGRKMTCSGWDLHDLHFGRLVSNREQLMQLSRLFTCRIRFTPERITEKNFSKEVKALGPKLYVISHDHKPVYVGSANKGMDDRLRQGFRNRYTYAWRHHLAGTNPNVDVWLQEGGDTDNLVFVKAVEAEVVFLIRQKTGQWPKYQTEIHFHQSNDEHREAAQKIVSCYVGASCPTS